MLNRFIMISGILILIPCLSRSVHNQNQEKKDHVPQRILNLLNSRSPTQNIRGYIELSSFEGDLSKAIPYYEKGLRSENIGIRQATEYALNHSDTRLLEHLRPLLESDDFERYRVGCSMAAQIGEPGAKFVDIVADKINNPKFVNRNPADDKTNAFNSASLVALEGMGPKAKPALDKIIACLDSKNIHVVRFACLAIVAMGPTAKPAADKLVEMVKHGQIATNRGWAGLALAKTGPNEKHDIVKILHPRLDAFNTIERERVLEGMAHLGPHAKSSLPLIKEHMETKRFNVQPYAAYAYAKVSGKPERPVELLIELAKNINTREQAIDMLGRIGPEAGAATEVLIEYVKLDPEEISLRELAVVALGKIGPNAKEALPALEELVRTELDWLLRVRAINSIKSITSVGPDSDSSKQDGLLFQ